MFGISGIMEAQDQNQTSMQPERTTEMVDNRLPQRGVPATPNLFTADISGALMIGVVIFRVSKRAGGWGRHGRKGRS